MSGITIYHNPKCGTSRNVLALIRNTGVEPEVIEYLKTPPGRDKLIELVSQRASACASCCGKKARLMTSWAWEMNR